MYVKAKVYIPVSSWGSQSCSTGTQQIITTTTNGSVRKEEGSYTRYNTSWSSSYTACDGSVEDRKSSYTAGCSCWLGDTPTGTCVKSGSGMCGGLDNASYGTYGYNQKCYWIKCRKNETHTSSGCNSGYDSWDNHGCGSQTTHCYYTTSSFKDANNKSNWKTSLSNAGGYAKTFYVYSYPLRVYIDYDGNGVTSICGSGDVSSWDTSGTNTYNSNANILYKDGNPVCTTEFKTGSMSLASNSNETTYIELGSTGNLKENEYYRVGYDFVGWNTKEDGTGNSFKDKEEINASTFNSGGKLYGYRAGETITLYAQWKKHDYKITYSYYCGTITKKDNNDIVYTYNYQEKTILPDLDVSSCDNGENTKFLGWYEDTDYNTKAEEIPSSYYKDLTLYAKLKQARYFNYKDNKWEYTSAE